MGWKSAISFLLVIFAVVILTVYWFFPLGTTEFIPHYETSDFIVDSDSGMQFYDNLRFSDKEISYKIYDECTLKKKQDAEDAFDILSEKTILNFYPVDSG